MTYQGIDTAARITAAQARKLRESGVSFVGRYLIPPGYISALTPQEIADLRAAGLAILLCWELSAEAVKGGAARGAQDGARARELAESFGAPAGTAIYFACDYNIPNADLIQAENYFRAAQTALGKFEAGIYGPLSVVEFLAARSACRKFWQCVAWSPRFSPDAQLRQYQWQRGAEAMALAQKCGIAAVDLDVCEDLRAAGLWMPGVKAYDDGEGGTIVENTQEQKKPWYADAMAWAAAQGIINDGRPNDPVTRAELATALQRFDARIDEKIKLHLPEDDSGGGLISD